MHVSWPVHPELSKNDGVNLNGMRKTVDYICNRLNWLFSGFPYHLYPEDTSLTCSFLWAFKKNKIQSAVRTKATVNTKTDLLALFMRDVLRFQITLPMGDSLSSPIEIIQ